MDSKVGLTARSGRKACGLLLFAGAAAPVPGHAQVTLEPYVSAQVEHDDNVFRTHHDTTADTIARYAAGGEVHDTVGQQDLFLKGEARKFDYSKLDDLDYKGDFVQGGWNWKLGSAADGVFRGDTERRIESFATRTGTINDTQLGTQRVTTGLASANIRVSPRWELRLRGDTLHLRNNLSTSENLDRDESSGAIGLGYLGLPISSTGFEVAFSHGNYPERDTDDPLDAGLVKKFDQVSYLLTELWKPSGISTIEAKAGYTNRDNDGVGGAHVDDFSGVTGHVSYLRTISSKSTFSIEAFRDVSSIEFIGENSVVQVGTLAAFDWKATPTIAFNATYRYSHDDYQDDNSANRKDHVHYAQVSGRWQVFRYVFLVPQIAYEKRKSNEDLNTYDDFRAMLALELRYKLL